MTPVNWLSTYTNLFIGRHDDYAVQLPTGRYRRIGKPFDQTDLHDHLLGVRTYGTYVMDKNGLCRFSVYDDDTPAGLSRLSLIQATLEGEGVASYLEQSRRGGHLWVFFAAPVLASVVRSRFLPYAAGDMEFYPKQNEGKGYGSLIRLPLGIHRLSGKRYVFVHRQMERFVSIAPTMQEMVACLSTFRRVELEVVAPNKPTRHPTHTSLSSSFVYSPSRRPKLTIREWNAIQDPLEVIGRYVDLSVSGLGCCPFGEHHKDGRDTHPSFKVYRPGVPGGYCWYCYTWQQGGSVFDFLCHYHGIDARTMWQRLQAKEV